MQVYTLLFVMLFQIKFSASNPPRVRCQQRRVEIVMSRDVMVFMVMVVGRRKMSLSGHSPCPVLVTRPGVSTHCPQLRPTPRPDYHPTLPLVAAPLR